MSAMGNLDPNLQELLEDLLDDPGDRETIAQIRLEMDKELAEPRLHTEWIRIEYFIKMGVRVGAWCHALKSGSMAQGLELVGFTPEELEIIGSELPVILMPGNPSTVGIWVNREYALVEPLIDEHVIDEPPIEGPPIGGPPTDIQE